MADDQTWTAASYIQPTKSFWGSKRTVPPTEKHQHLKLYNLTFKKCVHFTTVSYLQSYSKQVENEANNDTKLIANEM